MNEEETLPPVKKRRRIKVGGLVPDWRQAWKWFSTQGLLALSIAPIVYENFDFVQDFIDATTYHYTMGALGLMTLISRLVRQGDDS